MSALALTLALTLGDLDTLSKVTLQGLTFKAPTEWSKDAPDENSVEWTAPGDLAKLAVSAFPTDKFLPPAGCMKKMLEAVGKDGFETLTISTQPAAKKVLTDYLGDADAGRGEGNKVTTTTVIGCNGKVKWLLTFSAKTSEGSRLGPIYKRIIDSVSYGK
jgi:hypothetical protein